MTLSTKRFMSLIIVVSILSGSVGAIGGAVYLEKKGITTPRISLDPGAVPQGPVYSNEDKSVIDVVNKANPAVVNIAIFQDVNKIKANIYNLPSVDEFFGFQGAIPEEKKMKDSNTRQLQRIGGGSGFIIREDGLIVTNKHVVSIDDAVYTVILSDGKEYEGKVLARDPVSDVALLKIEAKEKLAVLPLGDSEKMNIGQTVIAIGYALAEFGNTVTKGVVSGIGRRVEAGGGFGESEVLEGAIQTDAAINPGNSGGPLLNLAGEVVGINTAVSSQGQLVGFAIPIHTVRNTIESVMKEGRIIRPWLGVRFVPVTPRLAETNKLPVTYGALVKGGEGKENVAVVKGSPAEKAGIVENDIILEINGKKLDDKDSLSKEIVRYKVDQEILLKILSKGNEKEIRLKLGEFPIQ